MNTLERIIRYKQAEIKEKKKRIPLSQLEPFNSIKRCDFRAALKRDPGLSVIAEFKRRSPTMRVIDAIRSPARLSRDYAEAGACAISVLTDQEFFGGCEQDLMSIKQAVDLPVLRKDFIIDEYQIYESSLLGADAILLIAGVLSRKQIEGFLILSQRLAITALVEVHTLAELKKVLQTRARVIGINNRDLKTLKVDINNCLRLRALIPDGYITVAESGIKNSQDFELVGRAGFDAVLIGTALVTAEQPAEELKRLIRRCGGRA